MKKYFIPILLIFLLVRPTVASEPIRIGLTLGLTGKYAKLGDMQQKGFKLWENHINEKGGILGRQVEVIIYDDESDPVTAQMLYRKLIKKDGVDLLLGPYSSGITEAVAPITEKEKFPLLVSGASADSLWQKGYRYLFGVYTPASKYAVGFLELLVMQGFRSVAIVSADDSFSKSVSDGTKKWAERFGLDILLFERFKKGKTDLDEFARMAKSSGAEVLIVCGHFNESVNMKESLRRVGWDPKAYFASVGPVINAFYEKLGEDSERVFSSSQWEFHELSSFPGAKHFYDAFYDIYGVRPSYHAATAYAAGDILAAAVEKAKRLVRDDIRDILSNMDITSVVGRYGVDETGMQIRHFPVIIQWQAGKKEIVWPKELRTAEPTFRIAGK
ncbi:MAG: amino acid ABC transporter substrate-binding protein [Deltaproteobacteria bacterium]|nr:amino acid ABC transporter substrate-binding protein [Deltaproteobacteria bacterium]